MGHMTASSDFIEDLTTLAPYGFEVAQESCVDCREYHSLWGFERLSGVKNNGFKTEGDLLNPLLRALPHKGKVLIAGAADAGLLAFVVQSIHDLQPRITVADRCGTPLAVCKRYADQCGLSIDTELVDLNKTALAAQYDLIFAHNVLLVQTPELHGVFLSNVGKSLSAGGRFVLVNRVRPERTGDSRLPPSNYATRVLDALMDKRTVLPDNESAFRSRLEALAERRIKWWQEPIDLDHVERALAVAHLHIIRRIDHERRRIISESEATRSIPITTHIFVLRREH
jgi:SAM-dependent methyltransferase